MPADDAGSETGSFRRAPYRSNTIDSLTGSANGSSFTGESTEYASSPHGKKSAHATADIRESLANMSVHDLAAPPRSGQRDSLVYRGSEALSHMDPSFHDVRQPPSRPPVILENTEGYSPLLLAARAGDVVEVNALLVQPGTDVLRRDPTFGQSALHFAVRGGHMSVLKALLSPRIVSSIINLPDNRRNTALHLAAAKSRRITKMLLDHGADTQFFNVRNQTPLGVHIITTTKDDPMLCEMLLRYKADPNAAVDQSTLLHVALDKGLVEIALRLVRHGARLDNLDENKKTVYEKVDKPLLKRLLQKVNQSPVWIDDKARPGCMLCEKKFSLGTRRHHCRYCGRLCCSDCGSGRVAAYKFPQGFDNRLKAHGSTPNHKPQRVCNVCFGVLNEQQKELGREDLRDRPSDLDQFVDRQLHVEWDEVKGQHNHPVVPQKVSGHN
ncbi:myosin-like protein [Achlya hypogyna]|uniref:Myosin-like protein n=1 Tax=Achlya hypogyna TaxID=1202772 RepID=A0A1V9ZJZ4_ACHHY|nr:myosin-like protein [Achlya hypogyna]